MTYGSSQFFLPGSYGGSNALSFSNGNLTATHPGGAQSSWLAAQIQSAFGEFNYEVVDKRVFEIVNFGPAPMGVDVGFIATSLFNEDLANPYGIDTYMAATCHQAGLVPGTIVAGGANNDSAYSLGVGGRLTVCLDGTTGNVFVLIDGTPIGSQNPVTGANPAFTLPSTNYVPFVTAHDASVDQGPCAFNLHVSGDIVSLPTGYVAWNYIAQTNFVDFSATPLAGNSPLAVAFTASTTPDVVANYLFLFDMENQPSGVRPPVDKGPHGIVPTFSNPGGSDPQVETDPTHAKFGTGTMFCSSGRMFVNDDAVLTFGTQDFQFDWQGEVGNNIGFNSRIAFMLSDGTNYAYLAMPNGDVSLHTSTPDSGAASVNQPNNVYFHNCLQRRSGVLRYFTDGVPQVTLPFAFDLGPLTITYFDDQTGGNTWNGWQDELCGLGPDESDRFYAWEGFTPPSAPYPLSNTGPQSYLWDFGDGNTSTERNPSHTYATGGTYTVSLTCVFGGGNPTTVEDTKPNYIDVTGIVNFAGSPLSGPAPLAVSFTDESTETPDSWSWIFGDGHSSALQNPSHTYATPGSYTVSLTLVVGGDPLTDIKPNYINVVAAPPPPPPPPAPPPPKPNPPLIVKPTLSLARLITVDDNYD